MIILHHYPASPFSEKVRLLLGYKSADYNAVTIPVIMPKPDLMPLTGGYRKTPVMQIDADIYCDSAIICKVIDRLYPDKSVFPEQQIAVVTSAANWTDTFFFRVCVAVAFQPRALAASPLLSDPTAAAAFVKDRAQLSEGSTQLQMDFEIAHPYFVAHLKKLDNQLGYSSFLMGDSPNILDFSTYHCCWFVHAQEPVREVFEPFSNVLAWMEKMAAFGQGGINEIEGSEALSIAKNAMPSVDPKVTTGELDSFRLDDEVEVLPIDYGFQPVRGQLKIASLEEIVVTRKDDSVGEIAVHFPRLGFRVRKPE